MELKIATKVLVFLVFCTFFSACCGQTEGDVRLVGGSYYQGTVEVFHSGQWGTICDDSWHYRDADVVCNQLGFEGSYRLYYRAYFGQGQGPIWIDQIRCPYGAKTLLECKPEPSKWGDHDCTKREDAGVTCNRKFPRKPASMPLQVSCPYCVQHGQCNACPLKQHPSPTDCSPQVAIEGVLFAEYNGEWLPVTGEGWDINDAQVACGELGYPVALPPPSLSQLWTNWDGQFIDHAKCGHLIGEVYPACSITETLGSGAGSDVEGCRLEVEENQDFRQQLGKSLLSKVYCDGNENKLLNCYFQEFGPYDNPELNVATVRCAFRPHESCQKNQSAEVQIH